MLSLFVVASLVSLFLLWQFGELPGWRRRAVAFRFDRIRSHFLICFLSMVILKILQKQLNMPEVSIDQLISTIRNFKLGYIQGVGYMPLFERNDITDRLQQNADICIDTQIVPVKTINAIYREMLKKVKLNTRLVILHFPPG